MFRTLIYAAPTIDSQGRLDVASFAGFEIFDRRGKALVIELPKAPHALAFAGASRNAFILARGAVWKIGTLTTGPANRAK